MPTAFGVERASPRQVGPPRSAFAPLGIAASAVECFLLQRNHGKWLIASYFTGDSSGRRSNRAFPLRVLNNVF